MNTKASISQEILDDIVRIVGTSSQPVSSFWLGRSGWIGPDSDADLSSSCPMGAIAAARSRTFIAV
jgi:hypothetical protein